MKVRTPNGIEPLIVSPATAATMLDLGIAKIWLMIKSGELQSTKIGKSRRVYVSSILALAGLQDTAACRRLADRAGRPFRLAREHQVPSESR